MIQFNKNIKPHSIKITAYSCRPDEIPLLLNCKKKYGIDISINDAPISIEDASMAFESSCVSISHDVPVTAPILNALHNAGVDYISTRSIGFDHIDINYAKKIGMNIGNVSYSPESVADYTLMLILMSSRHIKSILRHTDMQNYDLLGTCGRELNSLTVGVAGTGRIGQAVIKRLKGFGCKILAYDVHKVPDIMKSADYVDFDTLLKKSDILTLHMPASSDTYHIINKETIAKMKQNSILVNTSRGSLVDSFALIDAVESEHLSGAALDVIENEAGLYYHNFEDQPIQNHAFTLLKAFPNVIITPHAAFYTSRAVEEMVENSIKNCLLFEKGKLEKKVV